MTKDEVLADLRTLIEAADKTFSGRIGITAAQARAIHNYIATVVPDEPTATKLRAEVAERRWTGHGESGTELTIVIRGGGDYGNGYGDRSPEERSRAQADADRVNAALRYTVEPPARIDPYRPAHTADVAPTTDSTAGPALSGNRGAPHE